MDIGIGRALERNKADDDLDDDDDLVVTMVDFPRSGGGGGGCLVVAAGRRGNSRKPSTSIRATTRGFGVASLMWDDTVLRNLIWVVVPVST